MGGSIRKDMSSKVTHLIAAAATGDKYRYASGFGLPVLARSWVDACWERRDDPACLATDDDVIVSLYINQLMLFPIETKIATCYDSYIFTRAVYEYYVHEGKKKHKSYFMHRIHSEFNFDCHEVD